MARTWIRILLQAMVITSLYVGLAGMYRMGVYISRFMCLIILTLILIPTKGNPEIQDMYGRPHNVNDSHHNHHLITS